MNIVFRVNSSNLEGSGHFYRCLVLARYLKNKAKIIFISDYLNKDLKEKINAEKFRLFILKKKNIKKNYENIDAFQTASILKNLKLTIHLIVVDSYMLGEFWEKSLRKLCQKIMVIDDLKRVHDCDIYLNQNIFINSNTHKLLPAHSIKLMGPRYCIINTKYNKKKFIKKNYNFKNILIFMGGADRLNLTSKILKIISRFKNKNFFLRVVLGVENKKFNKTKYKKIYKNKIKFYKNLSTLDKVILKSQIAISSGGSVLWHFISMRLPSIVINQADNQIQNSKYLNKLGLIKLFNAHFNNNSLEKFLIKNIFENKKKFNISNKFSNLFDNKGLKRIANVILS